MIILVGVYHDAVLDVTGKDETKQPVRISDEYTIPSGIVRLIFYTRLKVSWGMIDSAVVTICADYGINAMSIRRRKTAAKRVKKQSKKQLSLFDL